MKIITSMPKRLEVAEEEIVEFNQKSVRRALSSVLRPKLWKDLNETTCVSELSFFPLYLGFVNRIISTLDDAFPEEDFQVYSIDNPRKLIDRDDFETFKYNYYRIINKSESKNYCEISIVVPSKIVIVTFYAK